MTIEEEIFKKTKINFNKLLKYGFIEENSLYKYSKNIMNNAFRIDIEINASGTVKGKVYDISFKDEYTNFRIEENIGSFACQVKEEFIDLLKNIKNNCFTNEDFLYEQSNRIVKFIKEKYNDDPNFEWEKFPGYATFRNSDNKKWYAIIMNVTKDKLGEKSNEEVEIINIKLEPKEIEKLLKIEGFYQAYHMNKKNWLSVILNDTISDEKIMNLIEKSYSYTITNKNNVKNEWLVPANPKYFDIEKALKENNTMIWKQSTDIKVNDIIYIYVGAPFSSIMYKFRVIETNIRYKYKDENIKIQRAMKIDLIARYKKEQLSFSKLKDFGVNAIRSQRYMPLALSEYINKIEK